jgi:Flp pilus assembly CpaF family ATPase
MTTENIPSLDDLPLFATPQPTDLPPRHAWADTTETPARGLPRVTSAGVTTGAVTGAADAEFWRTVTALRQKVAELQAGSLVGQRLDRASREELGRAHIQSVVRDHSDTMLENGQPGFEPRYEARLVKALFDAMFRLGRLQTLVEREGVVNIEITGHDRVLLLFADGHREWAPPIADSNADLINFLQFLASRDPEDNEVSFTRSNPHLELRLPGRIRLTADAWTTPVPCVSIRLQHLKHVDMAMLRQAGTIDHVLEQFLSAAVRARKSIVVSGQGQGSGKTTLLRALASAIDPWERLATIETDYELYLHEEVEHHPRVVAYETRRGTGELTAAGTRVGEISASELLRGSLRQNADRVLVGEVRGDEIVAMFEAMQGGNGSMSTVHADSARDVVDRLVGLTVKDSRLSETYAYRAIASSIDLIVYLSVETRPDGRRDRYVSQVIEVTRGERENPAGQITTVFVPGPTGRAVPKDPPSYMDDLVRAGFDWSLFNHTAGTWGQP